MEDDLASVSDYRSRPRYEVQELLMAECMFLFKRGSRNNADNSTGKLHYKSNVEKLFSMALPYLDTANRLMQALSPEELELIKQKIVAALNVRKVLHRFRLLNLYHLVAIDGTGLHSYPHEPYPECPCREYKDGRRVWTAYLLEAKIVCSNGFSISIATEWIKNPSSGQFENQDYELKVFVRLAAKLKKFYPRLPICIAADGLYPNQRVFYICESNGWKYIITLKDGNLKSLWEEIHFLCRTNDHGYKEVPGRTPRFCINNKYRFYRSLEYKKHSLNVFELSIEKVDLLTTEVLPQERFVHVSNLYISEDNCAEICNAGRMRWKIENEGYNEQKNTAYNLRHKYSRTSFNASQNYYQCLQIAHMINQVAYKAQSIIKLIDGHDTFKSFEEVAIALMLTSDFDNDLLFDELINRKCQFRY